MAIFLIVAVFKKNYGIGFQNKLPWRLSKEMKYFQSVTVGKDGITNAVLMGRKTWDSIPKKFRPLPQRLNIVVTSDTTKYKDDQDNGVLFVNSVNDGLSIINANKSIRDVFIIGGSQIYNSALPLVDDLLITEIETLDNDSDKEPEFDTFFDKKYVGDNFVKQDDLELERLVGFKPDKNVEEKGFVYNYGYYKRT